MNTKLNDFREDLSKFKILQARMLYMIYFLSKTNDINYSQKTKLKQLVISDNQTLIKIYDNFEKTFKIQKLVSEWIEAFFDDTPEKVNPGRTEEKKNTIDIKSLTIKTDKQSLKKQPAKQEEITIIQTTPEVAEVSFLYILH